MASELLKSYNNQANKSQASAVLEHLMDDITEQAGSNRKKIEAEEREMLVKWQLPGTNDSTTTKRQLTNLLANLMIAFPNNVTVIDKKQREWNYQETTNEVAFIKECESLATQLYPTKNKQNQTIRWIAITRIRTITTIQEWKNNDQFYTNAIEAKVYVFPHPFEEEEWDIVNIGFMKNIHAVHFPRDLLHAHITQLMKTQSPTPPPFQIIPQRITTTDKKATTKAYTIQCPAASTKQLTHLLTHGQFRNEQNMMFVPFRYKKGNPELFLQCVRQQNEIYHKTWIIKVAGLTFEAMDVIHTELEKLSGVFHVVPSKRLEAIGEWKLLVDQTKCAFIHRILTKEWSNLMSKIPQAILNDAPEHFPVPAISSKKIWDYQDSDSDADSYGSLLSIGTEVSQMTADDATLNELPPSYQFPTYAAAASTSNVSTASTQFSSPTTSTSTGWQKEKQEMQAQLQRQAAQIEKIQADLQARISRSQDLEEQLAQALDLAHSRDARHEEMMEKFELLLNQKSTLIDPDKDSLPTTPDRDPNRRKSPPSKKANTNMSPHRNIYSLFRPQPGKANSISRQMQPTNNHPTNNRAIMSHTYHSMDIDDEHPIPPPGAKSGKKTE